MREPAASHVLRIAILERLTMLATPATANEILRTALVSCHQLFVPHASDVLVAFVEGPLKRTALTQLGEDAAEALMNDLGVLLRTANAAGAASDEDSYVRLTARPARPQTLPTETEAHAPEQKHSDSSIRDLLEFGAPQLSVVFATSSDEREAELANAILSFALLHRVNDVFELVDTVATIEGPVVVVVDREQAAVRASTLAAAEPELPTEAQIVLWGDPTKDEFPSLLEAPSTWTQLVPDTTAVQLAAVVRAIGRASVAPRR